MEGGRLLGEAEGGGDAAAGTPSETQVAHPWPCYLPGEEELHFASGPSLHQQLEEEMREVQNYVDHVWALAEAQDALVAEYKQENEELRRKFAQLQLELDSQHKEVAELLALEGLTGIVHSSPSEQVAYLLVERSALLERMAALEEELGAPLLCLGRPCTAALQPPLEEPEGENLAWEEAERAPGGAPDRLCSAQHVIPALNEDLDVSEGEPGELREAVGGPEYSQWTPPVWILPAALGGPCGTIHVHSVQELKSLGFPERPLQRKLLPFPGFSSQGGITMASSEPPFPPGASPPPSTLLPSSGQASVPLKSSKSRCFPETRPTSARMSPASPPAEAEVGEPKAPAGTSCLLGGGGGLF